MCVNGTRLAGIILYLKISLLIANYGQRVGIAFFRYTGHLNLMKFGNVLEEIYKKNHREDHVTKLHVTVKALTHETKWLTSLFSTSLRRENNHSQNSVALFSHVRLLIDCLAMQISLCFVVIVDVYF